ncbi:DUF3533 domain-containing protein [Planosporangium flavigriseum]|uniref:Membrane protein n=1 Tax=Planosporangium flavigriseum TaxID=373681 RepID=A0A8J3PME9_9ACTN|nr:DUF3533 domain-containing protein [Planosporangium flavigriseum]NJC67365.1 DUF3533 domain-containing protein [Planosporangium flavigriseum]GIG75451.1 membrane protein [Planosporangium flavigriseum]
MTVEPASPPGFWADLRDAVPLRTVIIVIGVLLLQLGFILSYVGAFHHPSPHRLRLAVVAPPQLAAQTVNGLNAVDGAPLDAFTATSADAARRQIQQGTTSAALVVDPASNTDTLLIATGGGTSVANAVEQIVRATETNRHRALKVDDVVPLQSGDGRGLTGFYLVIGWIVGGYLVAALLGVAKGARPATLHRAVVRLIAMVPYAIVSGLGGAIIVGPVLGAMTGHLVALWGIGTLLVMAAATVTMAFQTLFGVIGIGVTVLLFVILGNPSAGGAYQPALLPPFWRAISGALPNGAGTEAVRRVIYFGGHDVTGPLAVIAAYAAAGTAVAMAAAVLRHRRDGRPAATVDG